MIFSYFGPEKQTLKDENSHDEEITNLIYNFSELKKEEKEKRLHSLFEYIENNSSDKAMFGDLLEKLFTNNELYRENKDLFVEFLLKNIRSLESPQIIAAIAESKGPLKFYLFNKVVEKAKNYNSSTAENPYIRFAYELMSKGVVTDKTKLLFEMLDIDRVKQFIDQYFKVDVGAQNQENGILRVRQLDQALVRYMNWCNSANKIEEASKLLEKAINEKRFNLACKMALNGFKISKINLEYYHNKVRDPRLGAQNDTEDLSNTILHNKFFDRSFTHNDELRITILGSSSLSQEERREFLTKHRGMSPVKMAIETSQYELAAKLILEGHTLEKNELSFSARVQKAFGYKKAAKAESESYKEKIEKTVDATKSLNK